jgi:hypothetical protein
MGFTYAGSGPEYTFSEPYTAVNNWASSRLGILTGVLAPKNGWIVAPMSWVSRKPPQLESLKNILVGEYPTGNCIKPYENGRRGLRIDVQVDVLTYAVVVAKLTALALNGAAEEMRHAIAPYDPNDYSSSSSPETAALIERALFYYSS